LDESEKTLDNVRARTREHAVGLDRFENADIQANRIPHEQEVRIIENLGLEIEIVNTGKMAAQLIKLDEIIPEGFKLVEKTELYKVENSYINMNGKILAPLRTEGLKLRLMPMNKGTYLIKPRIFYLDESGKYKSHEPEPATVVVKEIVISDWIKGPV
jgi:hypothetical protein